MVEVLSRRSSGQSYVYALVDRVPRRWRPPAAGVGGGSVVAQSIHDLVLIVSPVTSPLARTLRSQAVHDDVVASLMDAEAVVPFPFGTAVVDLQSWVEARARELRAALVAVRGAVEMTVRLLRLDAGVDGPHLRSLAERLIERAALPHWRYRPAANPTNVAASLSFLVTKFPRFSRASPRSPRGRQDWRSCRPGPRPPIPSSRPLSSIARLRWRRPADFSLVSGARTPGDGAR